MLHYILQTIAFQLFFLLIYDLFLRKETFFNWNRAYLLITSLLALILPFIKINQFSQVIPETYVVNLPQVVIGKLTSTELAPVSLGDIAVEDNFIWSWEYILYIGMAIAMMLFLFKMSKLAIMFHKSPKRWNGNLLIIKLLKSSKAFSFFHYIFLGERLQASDRVSILKHEQVHVEQRHTLDLLYFEVLRIIFWFNPLVYMYQSRISELHEFIADAKAVKYQDKGAYYENLLSQVFETQNLSFINPFFKKSLIKKRIVMLSKHPSKQKQLLKYALLIPMVLGMLVYTSTSAQESKSSELIDKKLYLELKEELRLMKEKGATPKEIIESFSPYFETIEPTKEQFYRAYVYNEYSSGKFIEVLKKSGMTDAEITKAKSKLKNKHNYLEYLSYLKTDEGLIEWQNKTTSGVIKQIVGNVNNLSEKEKKILVENQDYINNSKFVDYYKLILTDGANTKIYENEEKSKRIAEGVPDLSGGELEVPFAIIDQVPVYPGCDVTSQEEQKKCMTAEVSKFVAKNFNTNLAKNLGLTGRQRINVIFKIDKKGKVTGVRARAPHPELEQEATRVVSKLPSMKPGIHKGKPVIVPYSLPIVFQVKDDATEQTTTPLIEKMIAMRKQVEVQGNVSDEEQRGFDLLLKAVTGQELNPKLVEDIQVYTSFNDKTKLMERIADVFEQIQVQGYVSNGEEEALKGFLILVTDNGLNNPDLQEGQKLVEIPYAVVEQIPVYPGCEGENKEEQKKCTTTSVAKHVAKNFNTKLGKSLGLKGKIRISAMFKINREGYVEGVRARAPHPELEREAIRIIGNLPKMQPGMHEGKAITVPYSLPIVFEVKGDEETEDIQQSDEEILKRQYQKILEMQNQGANLMDISNIFITQYDSYIISREEYFKMRAFLKLMHERIIKSKMEDGEENPEGLTKLLEKRKTYQEYLEFKKTQEAKDIWENTSRKGEMRLIVGDFDNMTTNEKRRYDDYKTKLDNKRKRFYKFLISDGIDTRVLVNEKKEKKINKKQ